MPRLGMSYDLTGNGKTVVKVNWGMYSSTLASASPTTPTQNQALKTVTFAWTDRNADGRVPDRRRRHADGERALGQRAGRPNLKQPGSTQATAYLERQLTEGVGARVGFVYCSGARPDQHVSESAAGERLHRAVQLRRPWARQRPRQRRRPEPHVLRHPVSARQRLQRVDHHADRELSVSDDADADESAGERQVQDGRVFGQQAPEPQLLARRRLRLYVAARLPGGLPGHELSRIRRTGRSTTTTAARASN